MILHERAVYKSLLLQCEVDPELRVSFPQPALNQIILNLYSNAVANLLNNKVPSPSIHMHVRGYDGGHVDLMVQDNGTGLSVRNSQIITEDAERLPGQSGIRLKLSKRLIELHGGTLSLNESDNLRGSASVIRLPLESSGSQRLHVVKQEDEPKNLRANQEIARG